MKTAPRLIRCSAAVLAAAFAATLGLPETAMASATKTTLAATGADADASGKATLRVKRRKGAPQGVLVVDAKRLDPRVAFEVTIDGVRVGTLTSAKSGRAHARFRTNPRSPKDQLLGVDPRGRDLAIVRSGARVLAGGLPDDSTRAGKVRCCLADDSGPECEDRTSAECAAADGVDLGPGSCLPNPCSGGAPSDEVVCCLPDDSGPECEDRTAAQCAGEGGIRIDATACASAACAPTAPPEGDVRCCLPDDSGPKCEDRTAAECATAGGVNIGVGACLPNPCLGGGVTTTTLPPAALARVTCEKRSDRSRVSVDGQNLAGGSYHARITSGANTATSGARPTVGDEIQLDFDSDPGDIAAGATAIAADLLAGAPPAVTGEILDATNAVVASATATCAVH
jgi:hypothetical protein